MTKPWEDKNGLMSVKVTTELLELFRRLNWGQTHWMGERLKVGNNLYLRDGAKLAPYVGFYAGDSLPEMGAFSYSFSSWNRHVSIGAYCSLSYNIKIMGINHPLNYVTTTAAIYEPHPMFKAAFDDLKIAPHYQTNPQKPFPIIGNDVWIGQDVLIARGVTIGDGAVVAAGSVVTRNVQPYEIVGGAPAKTIRYRLPEAAREKLIGLRWWEYALPDVVGAPIEDVEAFSDRIHQGIETKTIHHVRQFSESLTDVIRSGRVMSFLEKGETLFT